jgi:hypothetical protein
MTAWAEAPESIVNTCAELVRKHHAHLEAAQIGIVLRDRPSSSGGKLVHAGVSLITGKLKTLLDVDILIWVAADTWQELSDDQRAAMIDHQLCHVRESDGRLYLVGHDLEEFRAVIDRYGLWNADLHLAGQVFEKQMPLFQFKEKMEQLEALNVRLVGENVNMSLFGGDSGL